MFQDAFMHQIAFLLQRDVCVFYLVPFLFIFLHLFASLWLTVRAEKQSCCQSHVSASVVKQNQSEAAAKKLSKRREALPKSSLDKLLSCF